MSAGLSVTTLSLVAISLLRRAGGPSLLTERERRVLCWIVLAASLVLYPMALGLGPFDPYALGFAGAPTLLAPLLGVAVTSLLVRWPFLLCLNLIALSAFVLGLGASQNLWDYLLDPWLSVYSAVHLVRARITNG